MTKIRMLGIAPFESLKIKMDEVAKEFSEIELNSYVGDLEKGLSLAQKFEHDYDLIISRGGTAKLIKEHCRIPVIEIELGLLDLLKMIKFIAVYNSKHAFIGFSNITTHLLTLAEILETEMDIITITDSRELPEIIEVLKEENYSLIIGDRITSTVASKYDMNTLLIESGDVSIRETLDKALFIGKQMNVNPKKAAVERKFKKIFNYSNFVYDLQGELLYQDCRSNSKLVSNIAQQQLELVLADKSQPQKRYLQLYTKIFLVESYLDGKEIYIMIREFSQRFTGGKMISSLTQKNNQGELELNNSSIFIGESKKAINLALKSQDTILIYGERGTGKLKVAKFLASKINNQNTWLFDFSIKQTMDEWRSLFNSENSVFYDTNATFILSGWEKLASEEKEQLFRFLKQNLLASNRLILLVTLAAAEQHSATLKQLTGYNIRLKPLNERKEDLSSIISLYLYEYNQENNTNILGFEPSALTHILDYSWPGNLFQLKQVVRQLAMVTTTSFISQLNTKEVLKNELLLNGHQPMPIFSQSFLQENTLKEIERQVVEQVVKNHANNRTKAAAQLEISRSTLWRILK